MNGEAIEIRGMKTERGLSVLIAVATFVLIGAAASSADTRHSFAMNSAANAPTERVVIAVEGMYCDSCAAGIRAMLKRTPGVLSADVSYAKKEAVVEYDQQKTTPEKIVEAINNLGYKASVKNKG